jgi:NADPH:quinone reductase-like Zn-dependent oxidoreductase
VQLLKVLGAQVTATCDTRRMELVRGLGADRVVDYTAGDFTRDAQAYDVVFDAVGKSSLLRCRRLLKPRGSYLWSDLGPMWQNLFFSGAFRPLIDRRYPLEQIVEAYRYVETGRRIGSVVIDVVPASS